MSIGIYLEAFPSSSQEVMDGTTIDLELATPAEILQGVQDAGIVGLGGAAFPTHVKLKIPDGESHSLEAFRSTSKCLDEEKE